MLTNEKFVPIVREQLPEIPAGNIVGEPVRRDTAAAVALAALICRRRFGNPVMAIVTADHLIEPVEVFQKTILSAAKAASGRHVLYTFGIEPSYPATGYGYLEAGEEVLDDNGIRHYRLRRFKEKPDRETAEKYLRTGRFFWNSGIFVWTVEAILKEFEIHLPLHIESISKAVDYYGGADFPRMLKAAFEPLERISVDFGIMERAAEVRTVASRFSWSDVGGWLALEEFLERDGCGNSRRGRLVTLDAGSNLVFCEDENETVALVGVKNLVVVRSGKKTLIVDKRRTEDVKKLVEGLEEGLK